MLDKQNKLESLVDAALEGCGIAESILERLYKKGATGMAKKYFIHRIHLRDQDQGSIGFDFYSTERIAIKEGQRWVRARTDLESPFFEHEEFEIEITKKGFIKFLNKNCGHPDNG